MAVNKELNVNENENLQEDHSYKGALASSLIFVGGGIVIFIVLLLTLYMVRI